MTRTTEPIRKSAVEEEYTPPIDPTKHFTKIVVCAECLETKFIRCSCGYFDNRHNVRCESAHRGERALGADDMYDFIRERNKRNSQKHQRVSDLPI